MYYKSSNKVSHAYLVVVVAIVVSIVSVVLSTATVVMSVDVVVSLSSTGAGAVVVGGSVQTICRTVPLVTLKGGVMLFAFIVSYRPLELLHTSLRIRTTSSVSLLTVYSIPLL